MTEKREPNIALLVCSLTVSPAVAGLLGGVLIYLMTFLTISIDAGELGGEPEFLAAIAALSIVAMIIGIVFSYVSGLPFILVAWAAAHFLTPRQTIHFAGALAIAGVAFAYSFFGQFADVLDPSRGMPDLYYAAVPAFAGAISGGVTGVLISVTGYKTEPKPA